MSAPTRKPAPPAGRPRLGVAWRGNPAHPRDAERSLPEALLSRLLAAEADWISLQYPQPVAAAPFVAAGRLLDPGEAIRGFDATAALVQALDAVVSVDSSVGQLAGALGAPLFVLLPFDPDWRWLLGREDSPWVRSARLIGQPRPGDWQGAIAALHAALARHLPR